MGKFSTEIADTAKATSFAAVADYLIKPVTKAGLIRVLEEVQSLRKTY